MSHGLCHKTNIVRHKHSRGGRCGCLHPAVCSDRAISNNQILTTANPNLQRDTTRADNRAMHDRHTSGICLHCIGSAARNAVSRLCLVPHIHILHFCPCCIRAADLCNKPHNRSHTHPACCIRSNLQRAYWRRVWLPNRIPGGFSRVARSRAAVLLQVLVRGCSLHEAVTELIVKAGCAEVCCRPADGCAELGAAACGVRGPDKACNTSSCGCGLQVCNGRIVGAAAGESSRGVWLLGLLY
jgi:hypothetical protein